MWKNNSRGRGSNRVDEIGRLSSHCLPSTLARPTELRYDSSGSDANRNYWSPRFMNEASSAGQQSVRLVRNAGLYAVFAITSLNHYSMAADKPIASPSSVKAASRDAASDKMPTTTAAGHETGLIPREVLFGN